MHPVEFPLDGPPQGFESLLVCVPRHMDLISEHHRTAAEGQAQESPSRRAGRANGPGSNCTQVGKEVTPEGQKGVIACCRPDRLIALGVYLTRD